MKTSETSYLNCLLKVSFTDRCVSMPTDMHSGIEGWGGDMKTLKLVTLTAFSKSLLLTDVFLCQQTCIVVLARCWICFSGDGGP